MPRPRLILDCDLGPEVARLLGRDMKRVHSIIIESRAAHVITLAGGPG